MWRESDSSSNRLFDFEALDLPTAVIDQIEIREIGIGRVGGGSETDSSRFSVDAELPIMHGKGGVAGGQKRDEPIRSGTFRSRLDEVLIQRAEVTAVYGSRDGAQRVADLISVKIRDLFL